MLAGAARGAVQSLPSEREITNSVGMKLVRVEPGSFRMGSDGTPLPESLLKFPAISMYGQAPWLPTAGDHDEQPAHQVTLTRPFYMGAVEVTNEQFERFDPRHQNLRGKHGFSIENDEAAVFVSWDDAAAFCAWLSKKEGRPYRLPTEAEWEYACRAGTQGPFWSGVQPPIGSVKNPDTSWYPVPERSRGRAEVVPLNVGRSAPNPWGLYDVHGNVEEWCSDGYGPYAAGSQTDPVGRAESDTRVTRGGSHGTVPFYLRSANRSSSVAGDRSFVIGFRVVLGEAPPTAPLPAPPPAAFQRDVATRAPGAALRAPDPSKPYFRGPRQFVKIDAGQEGPLYSQHNHDPGIAECPNGDLLAIWYTTVTERGREVAMAASRLRWGRDEWEPASPFWDAADRNDHAPAIWFDGKNTLFHFHGMAAASTWGPLAVVMRTSTDSGATWSRPHLALPEHVGRHQVVESVSRLKDGRLLLPCDAGPGGSIGTAIHLSSDNGRTWDDPGGTIAGIHAGVVQLRDGRLLALGRGSAIAGRMPMSLSDDFGKSWTYSASPFPPISGGQRLVLKRLKEGPLFFASFAERIAFTDRQGQTRIGSGLYTAISRDEGKTWGPNRLVTDDGPARGVPSLDRRVFTLSATSAEPRGYMAACQARSGLIHLITSKNHYTFNLAWLE
jgi:formylglycine-generating enzyme required for sulfatase activity